MEINVKEILKAWLIVQGFDGLQHESDCGCKIDDLMPCDEFCGECTPGYIRLGEEHEECDWYIVPKKPAASQPVVQSDAASVAVDEDALDSLQRRSGLKE